MGLVSSAASARSLCRASRNLLLLDLEDGRKTRRGCRLRVNNIGCFSHRIKAKFGGWRTGMSAGGAIDGGGGSGSSSEDVCMIVEHRCVGRVIDIGMRGRASVVGQVVLDGEGGRGVPFCTSPGGRWIGIGLVVDLLVLVGVLENGGERIGMVVVDCVHVAVLLRGVVGSSVSCVVGCEVVVIRGSRGGRRGVGHSPVLMRIHRWWW